MKLLKYLTENENSPTYKKAYRIATQSINDTKYLYTRDIPGVYATLVKQYLLPNTQDTVDGMRDAFIDIYFSGVEPEWYSMEAEKWWFGMTPDYFDDTHGWKFKVKPPNKLFGEN
jgi:hypothetical protein